VETARRYKRGVGSKESSQVTKFYRRQALLTIKVLHCPVDRTHPKRIGPRNPESRVVQDDATVGDLVKDLVRTRLQHATEGALKLGVVGVRQPLLVLLLVDAKLLGGQITTIAPEVIQTSEAAPPLDKDQVVKEASVAWIPSTERSLVMTTKVALLFLLLANADMVDVQVLFGVEALVGVDPSTVKEEHLLGRQDGALG